MVGRESAEVAQSEVCGFVTGSSTRANEAKVTGSIPEKAVTSINSLPELCTPKVPRIC